MKRFVFVFGLILFSGLVAAYDYDYKERFVETRYFPEDSRVVTRTVSVDYDNEERFSTYNYRHGYSYRITRDYFERKVDKRFDDYRYGYRQGYRDGFWDSGIKGVRYEYVPHLRSYERRECYITPPSDRLFYVEC